MSFTAPFIRDPNFGRDPWKGPLSADESLKANMATPVHTGADALTGDITLLPGGLNVYMSYVDNYKGWDELVARFGKTTATALVSITIFGGVAQCGDFEPGAMATSEAGTWLDTKADKSHGDPWVYTSAGNWEEMNRVIGSRKCVRWSAHYGHGPHICGPHTCGYPQADWTQWDDHGANGQNIDRSIGYVLPPAFYRPPAPKPVPTMHYERYDKTYRQVGKVQTSEFVTVKHYDELRDKPLSKIVPNRPKLKELRAECEYFSGRIDQVMQDQHNPHEDDIEFRKWRIAQLDVRTKGGRAQPTL